MLVAHGHAAFENFHVEDWLPNNSPAIVLIPISYVKGLLGARTFSSHFGEAKQDLPFMQVRQVPGPKIFNKEIRYKWENEVESFKTFLVFGTRTHLRCKRSSRGWNFGPVSEYSIHCDHKETIHRNLWLLFAFRATIFPRCRVCSGSNCESRNLLDRWIVSVIGELVMQ